MSYTEKCLHGTQSTPHACTLLPTCERETGSDTQPACTPALPSSPLCRPAVLSQLKT